ncbi:unnamed protein product [Psylliodes chrysocephalus]|uniref:Uncharacterized protein n=1 Tax=Psylliodes chrysocephalus TaxID=3402493 RepID=A0A9P0CN44_9CUCU|nr:unnamed protein product [Psylliodes chrysocephala]
MFTRILAMFSISLLFTEITESSPALAKVPRQYLTGVPGYIPVYIRADETPLEEINPDLAAAFNFYAQKHGRLTFARSIGDKSDAREFKSGFPESINLSEIDKVSLDGDQNSVEDNKVNETPKYKDYKKSSNIQKIPRS